MDRPTIYAIDFGTSNSLLAAANPARVFDPIPLDDGARDPTILRSILFFPDATHVFYGSEALREHVARGMTGRLIRSIKKHLPSRAFVGTRIDERPMTLEDLIGAFLGELRRRADRHFGVEVDRVVLGRPARFSNDDAEDAFGQRRLERAARLAGFRDVDFCPEPVAAAGAFRGHLDQPRVVLVGDFGGGTSDFTVLRMRPDGYDTEDVLAVGGVAVAGDALDGSLMRHKVARHFGAEVTYRVPAGRNVMTMPKSLVDKLCSPADLSVLEERDAQAFLRDLQRWSVGPDDARVLDQLLILVDDAQGFSIFEAIEMAKCALSDSEHAEVVYTYPGIGVREPVTRVDLETGSRRETARIFEALDETLALAGVEATDVDLVFCTGGTAHVPHIARGLRERFGADKVQRLTTFHSVIGGLAERARARAAAS